MLALVCRWISLVRASLLLLACCLRALALIGAAVAALEVAVGLIQ